MIRLITNIEFTFFRQSIVDIYWVSPYKNDNLNHCLCVTVV